jgi:F420-dependent oxidoreductase-like protein
MAFIGLHLPSFTFAGVEPAGLFPRILDIAATAEASGFSALSVMDHFHQIGPQGTPDEPMLEAYTTLAAIAARTSRVELLTLVTGVVYHNPAHLAKQVTTLDVISGGRAILGIGAAWNEEEARAYGFDFPPVGRRLDRLEEAVQICRSMFDSESTTFEGRYHLAAGAINMPRPLRDRVPIMIGGGGERRTLRLVARHADQCNVIGDPPTVRHKLDVLRGHCEAEGRDPAEIVKTAHAGIVVIDESEAEVRRRLQDLSASPPPMLRGLDAGQLRQRLVSGTPDQVAERLRAYRDAGAEGITMSIRQVWELRLVELAASAAQAAFS